MKQTTWASKLNKRVIERKPPRHTIASISLSNAHALYVHQVNDQRKAHKDSLLKTVDDQTTRIRNGQQKLTETKHAHRKSFDEERSTGDRLLAQSMSGAQTPQSNAKLIEVRA